MSNTSLFSSSEGMRASVHVLEEVSLLSVLEELQRIRDRHNSSSTLRLWAVEEAEPLTVIRPSTAGYTRFCSEIYLENTEMSKSPEREESERKNLGVCFRTLADFQDTLLKVMLFHTDGQCHHFRLISPCVCVFELGPPEVSVTRLLLF